MWVWISIVTASQLSWTLKCQPWVQALTCPHVVLSTVAATGIKHTFLARFENRNATVVASAAVRCLCTVIIYYIIPLPGGCEVQEHTASFFLLTWNFCSASGKCSVQSVKVCERHPSTDKIIGSLVCTTEWQGYAIKNLELTSKSEDFCVKLPELMPGGLA